MERKCEYCGAVLGGNDKTCPSCAMPCVSKAGGDDSSPKSIAGLREYAEKRNISLEDYQIYIDDRREASHDFVIYFEDGVYTVYRVKSDLTKTVRYKGEDESKAVDEAFKKLRSRIVARKQQNAAKFSEPIKKQNAAKRRRVHPLVTVAVVLLAGAFVFAIFQSFSIFGCGKRKTASKDTGYYKYQGSTYYNQNGSWYEYDKNLGWIIADPSDEFLGDYSQYYEGKSYSAERDAGDFSRSEYYDSEIRTDNDGGWLWDVFDNDDERDGDW